MFIYTQNDCHEQDVKKCHFLKRSTAGLESRLDYLLPKHQESSFPNYQPINEEEKEK